MNPQPAQPTRRLDFPATRRNREPIRAVLQRWLPARCDVLEVASGSGQHAVFFAAGMPGVRWQPTDPDPRHVESCDAWRADVPTDGRMLAARALDVHDADWAAVLDGAHYDALYCANMIHIAPWSATTALFAGAAAVLRDGGAVVLYGPFHVGGAPTAPSNAEFDADLRARDPRWGVRDLEDVVAVAEAHGFLLREREAMPANNLMLWFGR
ncbi:MAG: hypothetical protein RIT45_2197 [Pseudomonadota bacterium]|jgi:hypothetical protein